MHSPMHSLGEIRMHPSTPCSISKACGGRRSNVEELAGAARRTRLARFKSVEPAPSLETESIMALRNKKFFHFSNRSYFFPCTGCSQKRNEATRNSGTGVSPVRSKLKK